jgi:hypothetical protein
MVEEVKSCMIYLIHYNNLCKCHNILLPITTIKEKKKKMSEKGKENTTSPYPSSALNPEPQLLCVCPSSKPRIEDALSLPMHQILNCEPKSQDSVPETHNRVIQALAEAQ